MEKLFLAHYAWVAKQISVGPAKFGVRGSDSWQMLKGSESIFSIHIQRGQVWEGKGGFCPDAKRYQPFRKLDDK